MSRREIRYTVRLSEQEYQQLKKKILENNEWTFKYGTKKDRVNISAYIRDILFREEKEAGASTKETGDLILRLAGHKDKKLYLTEGEHKKAVQALNGLRDTYIENGRYTDGIDTVLMRIMNARYRTYRTR